MIQAYPEFSESLQYCLRSKNHTHTHYRKSAGCETTRDTDDHHTPSMKQNKTILAVKKLYC